ncbi:MAG: dihydrolipoyl dehydrogenase [Bacteroidota bacterium]
MTSTYDLIIIGSGPGGYVAAISAAQLGMRVAVVEREALGGVCLNWGCIPTKALLKSAQVFNYIQEADHYGIQVKEATVDFPGMIQRSRAVAHDMNKGIQFLFKKHNITTLYGVGKLHDNKTVSVQQNGTTTSYRAEHILLATGSRHRPLPNLNVDHRQVIGYREAMSLDQQPQSMIIVGAGYIGVEFAYFYNSIGTQVTLVESKSQLLPLEEADISEKLAQSFKKTGMSIYTSTEVLDTQPGGTVRVSIQGREEQLSADKVLVAVGVAPNIEELGLESLGVATQAGRVVVDEFYRTHVPNLYAIGDMIQGPALAHVASAEGTICVEKIAGLQPEPLDYLNIPSCVYCQPEVASIGYTTQAAQAAGYTVKVGKFPFSASGKACAVGAKDGFVKVIFDAQHGEWLGAHMIGAHVTELISEVSVARKLETTAQEIMRSVHPHPTLSESIVEAVADAYQEAIHL